MPLKPEHQAALDKFTSTDHRGKPVDRAKLTASNPMIAKILMARVAALSDDEQQTLKSIFTPQTTPVLKKLFPEIAAMVSKGVSANGG